MKLTEEQQLIINNLDKKLPEQSWIIIQSRPGCGKSYVLRYLQDLFMQKYNRSQLHVLAPTNLAANNVHGNTIHSFLGCGEVLIKFLSKLDNMVKYADKWLLDYKEIEKFILEELQNFGLYPFHLNENTSYKTGYDDPLIIIFDETSMISLPLFYTLMVYVRFFKQKWFLFFGDKNQLKPVSKIPYTIYDLISTKSKNEILIYQLSINMRQCNNVYFDDFIKNWNCLTSDTILNSELKNKLIFGGTEDDFKLLPYPKLVLCGTRKAVENVNNEAIKQIKGESKTFYAENQVLKPEQYTVKDLFKMTVLPSKLELKIGCQVVALKTVRNNERPIHTNEIFNLQKWGKSSTNSKEYVVVCDKFGKSIEILPYEENIYVYNSRGEELLIGTVVQIPLQLYFAATIHRIQGSTVTVPTLIKFNTFWDNRTNTLAYVAVSRLQLSENLYYDRHPFSIFQNKKNKKKDIDTISIHNKKFKKMEIN